MYNIDIYNKKIENDNMVYSIDKIRLKTYMTYSNFSEIEFAVETVYKEHIKKFWISERPMCFRYNYNLEFEDFSFYFGFMHNSSKKSINRDDLQYNFTIEFNPNKARENQFIVNLLNKFPNWYIKAYDLAIDIPISILDLLVDIARRRKILTESHGGDNITHSYGKNDGRIKIYNKKRESNLNIVGDLTRVEISREVDDFPVSNIAKYKFEGDMFPYIYLNEYIFSISDYTCRDKTLMACLYAVQSGYPIKELSRAYRKKLDDLFLGGSQIKFSKPSAEQALKQTIYFYFVRRGAKQVIF